MMLLYLRGNILHITYGDKIHISPEEIARSQNAEKPLHNHVHARLEIYVALKYILIHTHTHIHTDISTPGVNQQQKKKI